MDVCCISCLDYLDTKALALAAIFEMHFLFHKVCRSSRCKNPTGELCIHENTASQITHERVKHSYLPVCMTGTAKKASNSEVHSTSQSVLSTNRSLSSLIFSVLLSAAALCFLLRGSAGIYPPCLLESRGLLREARTQ